MAVKLPKLSKKVLTILIAVAAILVIIAIVSVIAALVSDTNRLRYEMITNEYIQELEAQTPDRQFACLDAYVGTYAVVDVKDTYRGGIFAKEKLTIPAEYKGKPVSSIISLQNLQKIKELEISEGIVNITNSAFYGCTFEKIDIPNSVKFIGSNAFKECRSLASVTLPTGVTAISEGLFTECRALTSVTMSSSVTNIDSYAFQNCQSLTNITLPDALVSVGITPFVGCSSFNFTISNGAKYIGKGSNNYYLLAEKESAEITSCAINGATVIIADAAFQDCKALTSVTLGEGLKSIPSNIFNGCSSLTSVSIPNSVTNLGSYAFANCTSLASVHFGSGLTSIPTYAFSGCTSLVTIEIPSNVKVINNYAFSNCSKLENVTLNAGLERLGGSIFASCVKLESITFNGTKAQWEAIQVGTTTSTRWNRNATNLKTVQCSGGEIVEL